MDESRPDRSLDKGIKSPNELDRAKNTKLLVHTRNHPKHNKETHGLRDDIDANTPIRDVKGPNVFERVKEEFEAIVGAINPSKEDKSEDSLSSVERDYATFTGSEHQKQSSPAEPELMLDKGIKAPNVLEKGKEETDAPGDNEKRSTNNKETHGLRDDIDVNTPLSDIKGPTVFERVKEELEAIVDTIHTPKEDKNQKSLSSVRRTNPTFTGLKHEKQSSLAGRLGKIKIENVGVKTETLKEKSPASRHKETHGRGEDIDADIPISEFKGPSIFHRAKEEIEAIVDTINLKKESDSDAASPKKDSPKEGGFRATVSKRLHRIYSKSRNQD